MSHSTVLVIGEDPELMLEPYNEDIQVEAYRSYEKAATPQEFWYFDKAVNVDGLALEVSKLPSEVTWPELIEFLNTKWGDEEPYRYDFELDRMYQMSTYNPQSKWDWYTLGGRWTGFFKLLDQGAGAIGHPGIGTSPAKPGWVDQARKYAIDWEGMRAEAEAEAVSRHAQVRAALSGLPPITKFSTVRAMFPDNLDAARKFYHEQPGMQALRTNKLDTFMGEPVEVYHLDAEDPLGAYVAEKRRNAVLTFAILNKDGWHERGDMGWWGIVTDEKDDWPETATRLMDEADEGALFSVYDVHI
jgi:hypothetical protein